MLWGFVMWHWRHYSTGPRPAAPGEMVTSQVRQMDFIYSGGDASGTKGWLSSTYLAWIAALLYVKRFV